MEKKDFTKDYVSGGYFVVNKSIFKYITNKNEMLERAPNEKNSKFKKNVFIFT